MGTKKKSIWFDLPDKEKRKILRKVTIEANKEMNKLLEKHTYTTV